MGALQRRSPPRETKSFGKRVFQAFVKHRSCRLFLITLVPARMSFPLSMPRSREAGNSREIAGKKNRELQVRKGRRKPREPRTRASNVEANARTCTGNPARAFLSPDHLEGMTPESSANTAEAGSAESAVELGRSATNTENASNAPAKAQVWCTKSWYQTWTW